MEVPNDVICHVCKKFFCCSECRHKHETKNHAIAAIVKVDDGISKYTEYIFCPICEEKPLVLKSEMHPEILDHIKQNHLPLQCRKCFKLYAKLKDLREFSNCFQPQGVCQTKMCAYEDKLKTISETNSVNVVQTTIATQTSPLILEGIDDSRYVTPISMINLDWKTKSKVTHEGFVTDSVSSIKNISSINNSSSRAKSIGIGKGKLVRSTSTPLPAELLYISKSNEQAFNASSTSGQVSSIYNSGCDSDGSNHLSAANQAGTPSKQALDINRYRKVGVRPKMSAVTPLRQIMSKSIQKAFAEHGLSKALHGANGGHFRKIIFENTENSLFEHPISHATNGSTSPLDLRLSPALRRSNSAPSPNSNKYECVTDFHGVSKAQMRHKILLSSKKTTTESIVITSTQHLAASVELARDTNNDGANSNSLPKPNTVSISSNCAETHSLHRSNSNAASLYQTCSSVKIIHTSTELSALNIERNNSTSSTHAVEQQLFPARLPVPTKTFDLLHTDYADHTPTTRIKGAAIKEKLIKFDTPKVEDHSVQVIQKENSSDDIFFTPDATPLRKPRVRAMSSKGCHNGLDMNKSPLNQKKLCVHDGPSISSIDRIENITDDESDNVSDEVFSPEKDVQKISNEMENKKTLALSKSSRNLWSLMSSAIMRIPSFKGGQQISKTLERTESLGLEACSKFIIKRCASIAGSIVRSKPLVSEEQLKSLKRKRTYTIDNQSITHTSYSSCAESSSIIGCESITASNKRFRIQPRKPIDRMRINN